MSVSHQERITSSPIAPENALDLIALVEGTHSGVPTTDIPTGYYMRINGGPDSGFERAGTERSSHALLSLIVTPDGGVYSVDRVTLYGEDGSYWSGQTVNDLNENTDGRTIARTKGFLDIRDGFQPIVLDEGVELTYAPGEEKGADTFIIINTSGQPVRVAHGSDERPNNGGGYFGNCWADTRIGDRSLASLQKGGFLPGQANAGVTAKLLAGQLSAEESPMTSACSGKEDYAATGKIVLQGEVISDVTFRRPDGKWAQRSMNAPKDAEEWREEHADYLQESSNRTDSQLEEWRIAQQNAGAHWLADNVARGEALVSALETAPLGETVGMHRATTATHSYDGTIADIREISGMFGDKIAAAGWHPYRGKHSNQNPQYLLGQAS